MSHGAPYGHPKHTLPMADDLDDYDDQIWDSSKETIDEWDSRIGLPYHKQTWTCHGCGWTHGVAQRECTWCKNALTETRPREALQRFSGQRNAREAAMQQELAECKEDLKALRQELAQQNAALALKDAAFKLLEKEILRLTTSEQELVREEQEQDREQEQQQHELQKAQHEYVAVSVPIYVGLSRASVVVQLERGMPLDAVKAALKSAADISSGMDLQLSACGAALESVEEVLSCHSRSEEVFATVFKSVEAMSVHEIIDELTLEAEEFRGHAFTLSKLSTTSTARTVSDYLWSNQVLLTSAQAQQLFDQLVPKLRPTSGRRTFGLRGDLILVLHSFCLHTHHIWEPDDGNSECLWANMSWAGAHLQHRKLTRGELHQFGPTDGASSAERWSQEDVCRFREVRRSQNKGAAEPLTSMSFVRSFDSCWREL